LREVNVILPVDENGGATLSTEANVGTRIKANAGSAVEAHMDRATAGVIVVREAAAGDLEAIRRIYNEGIEDRIATLDADPKSGDDIVEWFADHGALYAVLVAERAGEIAGWASLNRYALRCACGGVADLSVYVARDARGSGVGSALLARLEPAGSARGFHKIVLFTFASNAAGRRLYAKRGFREVGVFREHGRLDGRFVDILAMEKIVRPLILFVCRHNTGRSQMAEAYLRAFAGDLVEAASAGTIAAGRPDPGVVAAMAEDGLDISAARPKLLDPAMVERAERIITMGCDVAGVPRVDDDWGLPDPKGQPPERVREIRDLARAKARALAAEVRRLARE
jgi:phosphinothricin acetyltransferase